MLRTLKTVIVGKLSYDDDGKYPIPSPLGPFQNHVDAQEWLLLVDPSGDYTLEHYYPQTHRNVMGLGYELTIYGLYIQKKKPYLSQEEIKLSSERRHQKKLAAAREYDNREKQIKKRKKAYWDAKKLREAHGH